MMRIAFFIIVAGVLLVLASFFSSVCQKVKSELRQEERTENVKGAGVIREERQEIARGVIIEFGGVSFVRAPHIEAQLHLTVAHSCEAEDELILQKVDICGEDGRVVKSFEINRQLETVRKKMEVMESLQKEIDLLESKPGEISEEEGEQITKRMTELGEISDAVRSRTFTTGYFTVDLKRLKEPLGIGDEIPIIARVTIVHNSMSIVLAKTLTVGYRPSLPKE